MIRIIMSGCNGHMGQVISGLVKDDPEAEIVAGIDLVDNRDNGYPVFTNINDCDVQADAMIDFSSAKATEAVLAYCTAKKLPLVLCTTGLSEEQLAQVAKASESTAVLRSANMSLGINTLLKLVQEAAKVLAGAGFDMEIYYKLPLRTRLYDKNMKLMLETAPFWGRYKYVRGFSLENQFVYMLASAAYAYVTDALLIRNVLDLYVFHRMWKEKMNIESIEKRMEGFRVDELGKKILQIAYMWFGSKGEKASDGLPEDIKVYDILENRILSRGVLNNETDQQALELERLVQREINREQSREKRIAFIDKWRKRRKNIGRMLRWVFPEHKYMCVIYPVLEDFPILLPICWIWRGIRQLKGLLISNLFKKKPD